MVAALELWNSAKTPRPPLKWAGGKRWLVPHLMRLWMPHRARRLVEPLCGGLAVALGLMPARALLNDISPHTTNFYRHLKRGLCVTIPMRNESDLYYAHRERFNVPFGRYQRISYTTDFSAYRGVFADWELSTGDFESLVISEGDFIYADPPYDVEFTQYSKEQFGWAQQVRLAEWLAAHRGPVAVSNQATERIVRLYDGLGFEVERVSAPRRISCTGDRTPAAEILALKGV